MIPLGSCTMTGREPRDGADPWPEFGPHPSVRPDGLQAQGYLQLFEDEQWLADITGYGAGAAAERIARRVRGRSRSASSIPRGGQARRVPHPRRRTAPTPRDVAGMRGCRVRRPGNVDLDDLKPGGRALERLASLMVTYPSTRRLRGTDPRDLAVVHEHGGQVYLDRANLNARQRRQTG
jgi:glycine dehydrogenase